MRLQQLQPQLPLGGDEKELGDACRGLDSCRQHWPTPDGDAGSLGLWPMTPAGVIGPGCWPRTRAQDAGLLRRPRDAGRRRCLVTPAKYASP